MPSSITHAYFSIDIYDHFGTKKRKRLEPYINQFKTFAQGPDVFFFYNLLIPQNGKDTRKIGHYMQRHKTQSFFVNLVTTIKNKRLEKNPEVLAYLYGFIAHYVLDMTMHPYIIYKTGVFERKDKRTHKYFGGHEQMETYIDAYFIKVRGKVKPNKFKCHNFCFKETNLSLVLKEVISETFELTFNKKDIGNKYQSSIKQIKFLYKFLRNDCFGIKHKVYSLLRICPFGIITSAISFNVKLNKNEYYLNLNKEVWNHPLDKDDRYNYSFIELYSIALSRALKLINEVDKVLLNKKDIEYLNELFPDLSYATGRDCKLGVGKNFSF